MKKTERENGCIFLSNKPTVTSKRVATRVGCHLNRSISLTRTRRCSVETTSTRLVVDDHTGLCTQIGRPGSHFRRKRPSRPEAGREADPPTALAPDIRNGFCYSAKGASTAGFAPRAAWTTDQSRN